MKISYRNLVLAGMLCSLAALPVQAQMAESLKHKMHSTQELGATIVTSKELDQLDSLMKNPNVKILCLQLWPESMNEARARALVDWVRSGKTLWFYDARLGPWFGFEPVILKKEQFKNKPESASLGGKEVPGVATIGLNISDNDLNTGVGQVSLFLPQVGNTTEPGNETYGTIAVKGDTVGLLRWAPDSPAMAAVRMEGKGAIFFKPLIWTDALSGDRFQANVLEWSAGYQIVAPGGEGFLGTPPGPKAAYVQGKPATPLFQGMTAVAPVTPNKSAPALDPDNVAKPIETPPSAGNDKVKSFEGTSVGKVVTDVFEFETPSASLKLNRQEIKQITLGGATGLDIVETWDGQIHKGVLMLANLKIQVAGETRTISKKSLQTVTFEHPPVNPAKSEQPKN